MSPTSGAVSAAISAAALSADGSHERLSQRGPILGVLEDIDVPSTTITLEPGDVCVIYTDGATDVLGADGTMFGEDRLVEVVEGCRGMHPDAIARAIEEAVLDFGSDGVRDDLAVLVVAAPLLLVP